MKNILISRFYEQFSRNGSAMAPEQLFEKISNIKIMNMLYIILKHVVWRFRICNYFREIFKFRENISKNRFRENFLVFIKKGLVLMINRKQDAEIHLKSIFFWKSLFRLILRTLRIKKTNQEF